MRACRRGLRPGNQDFFGSCEMLAVSIAVGVALQLPVQICERGALGCPTWQKRGTAPVTRRGGGEGGEQAAGQLPAFVKISFPTHPPSGRWPGAAGLRQSCRLPASPGQITIYFPLPSATLSSIYTLSSRILCLFEPSGALLVPRATLPPRPPRGPLARGPSRSSEAQRQFNIHEFLYSVFCILYSVFCILYSVFLILYSVFCFLFSVFCTQYSVFCILFSVFCILYSVSCILYSLFFILYSLFFILYSLFFILYSLICILYSVFCDLYSIFSSVCCEFYIHEFQGPPHPMALPPLAVRMGGGEGGVAPSAVNFFTALPPSSPPPTSTQGSKVKSQNLLEINRKL